MGRRKIEIQAITNERNRSVTFIKRKNGLFKKAYELGVLCSVDVAVIIFDERPGHSRKLYEYSSCDIRNIVQRHLRHDGETDSRTTADFSGNAPASKDDDDNDVDAYDEDVDEDDAVLLASMKGGGSKRRGDGTLKAGPAHDIHSGYPRHGHSQEIIELSPRLPSPQHSYNDHRSSIPISSDRLRPAHEHQSKKPRLQLPSMDLIQRQPYSRSGSPSSGPASPILEGNGGYTYPPPFRHSHFDVPPSSQRHSHHPNQHQYPQYTPMFPLRQSRGPTPPPPSFVPLHSDFSLSSGARHSDGRGAPSFPPPGSWGSGGQDRSARGDRSITSGGGGGGGGGVTADLFAAFLDAREEGRIPERREPFASDPGLTVTGGTFGLDWPVHNPGVADSMGPSSAVSSIGSTGGDGGSSGGRASTGASTTDWLDFLSGTSGAPAPPPSSAASSRGMDAPWAQGGDAMSLDSDGELFSGMGHGMDGQGVKKEVNG